MSSVQKAASRFRAALIGTFILLAGTGDALAKEAQPFVPVLTKDFPDPFVIESNGRFLAYATNPDRTKANVQMASSTDLANWELLKDGSAIHDAMPDLPSWAKRGFTWAPEVLKTDSGYVLYFTARERKHGIQCVGAAHSADPLGPFTSSATEPLVCQYDLGGTIDASPFRDADGQLYLYYKNDGNAVGKPTQIFAQKLSPDGLSLVGEPVSLLRNDREWEGRVVEAPTMVRTSDGYALFFSANDYGWQESQRLSSYAMGVAKCASAAGPCSSPEAPFLYSFMGTMGCLSGPGHQAVFQANGRSYIAFHAWAATSGCRRTDLNRYLYVAPLGWKDGKPVIGESLRPTGTAK